MTFVLRNVGRPGSIAGIVGTWLGSVLGVAGVLNPVLYAVFRAIYYWQV